MSRPELLRSTFVAVGVMLAGYQPYLFAEEGEATGHAKLPVVSHPPFQPNASRVALFDGLSDESLSAKVIAHGPNGGNLLVTNLTSEPLTVDFSEPFVAVNVLKQFGQGNNPFAIGQNQNGPNALFQNAAGPQNQGAAQDVGGVAGAQNNQNQMNPFGNNNNNNNQNPFFSIPPETVLKVKFKSVCLNHGAPNPTVHTQYRLVKATDYSEDERLAALLQLVRSDSISVQTIQAAAWHLTDDLNWDTLRNKSTIAFGRRRPYFSSREVDDAKKLIVWAEIKSAQQQEQQSRPTEDAVAQSRTPGRAIRPAP